MFISKKNQFITVRYNSCDKRKELLIDVKNRLKYDLINNARGKKLSIKTIPINLKWNDGVSLKVWEQCMKELNISFKRVEYTHTILSVEKIRYKKAFELVRLDS